MSKRLVIFGGSGFVGGNLAQAAQQRQWDVCVTDNCVDMQTGWRRADITDLASVELVIASVRPEAVVNVAAIADIDRAEREKEQAYQVNVTGARNVAESCARWGSRHIFFSSDAVFDGSGSGYTEEDLTNPVNYYGRTKADAEQSVLQAHPASVVARISLVLGYPIVSGNSFFMNLENKLRQNQIVNCPTFEIRTPVDVYTLSDCVLELCDSSFSGLLHIGATDSINRYQLTKILARRMGFDEALIRPQEKEENQPGRAPRHKNGIISVAKAQRVLKTRLLNTAESIDRAFRVPNERLRDTRTAQ